MIPSLAFLKYFEGLLATDRSKPNSSAWLLVTWLLVTLLLPPASTLHTGYSQFSYIPYWCLFFYPNATQCPLIAPLIDYLFLSGVNIYRLMKSCFSFFFFSFLKDYFFLVSRLCFCMTHQRHDCTEWFVANKSCNSLAWLVPAWELWLGTGYCSILKLITHYLFRSKCLSLSWPSSWRFYSLSSMSC